MKKYITLALTTLLVLTLATAVNPQPTHAFTLFGVKFFEPKPKPTPTPKPSVTPTPIVVVTPTPVVTATPPPAMAGQSNLPSTGPEESAATILLVVVGGFVARKYWQVSHRI